LDAAHLASIPIFSELVDADRELVARWADEIDVPAGKEIVTQGEPGYEFFVVEAGTATVLRDGEPIASLSAGDFFGEIALLETGRRNASVVAASPMRLMVMTREDFQRMTRGMPEAAARIGAAIRERLTRS
jgi:CRP-like cAMP-binding protein